MWVLLCSRLLCRFMIYKYIWVYFTGISFKQNEFFLLEAFFRVSIALVVVFLGSTKTKEWTQLFFLFCFLFFVGFFFFTHTHTEGNSPLCLNTSKLAAPWGTSNAGEAIKRQKLFSVRSWFIWLKNETTNPTDIIFPFQGLLYQAQPKLFPGGNPLKSRRALLEEPRPSVLSLVLQLSWLCFCRFLMSVLPQSEISSLAAYWINAQTHTDLSVLMPLCSA